MQRLRFLFAHEICGCRLIRRKREESCLSATRSHLHPQQVRLQSMTSFYTPHPLSSLPPALMLPSPRTPLPSCHTPNQDKLDGVRSACHSTSKTNKQAPPSSEREHHLRQIQLAETCLRIACITACTFASPQLRLNRLLVWIRYRDHSEYVFYISRQKQDETSAGFPCTNSPCCLHSSSVCRSCMCRIVAGFCIEPVHFY